MGEAPIFQIDANTGVLASTLYNGAGNESLFAGELLTGAAKNRPISKHLGPP
jgi:hypothetical protein